MCVILLVNKTGVKYTVKLVILRPDLFTPKFTQIFTHFFTPRFARRSYTPILPSYPVLRALVQHPPGVPLYNGSQVAQSHPCASFAPVCCTPVRCTPVLCPQCYATPYIFYSVHCTPGPSTIHLLQLNNSIFPRPLPSSPQRPQKGPSPSHRVITFHSKPPAHRFVCRVMHEI